MEEVPVIMRMVSLDTSTQKSGCALFEDGKLVDHLLIDLHRMTDAEKRMNKMCSSLARVLKNWEPDAVYIEYPEGQGGNIKTFNMLCEILGAVRLYCAVKDCEFNEVRPPQWRKWLGMDQSKKKRAELKQMSMDYVLETFGVECNNDEADAICIGCAVLEYYKTDV